MKNNVNTNSFWNNLKLQLALSAVLCSIPLIVCCQSYTIYPDDPGTNRYFGADFEFIHKDTLLVVAPQFPSSDSLTRGKIYQYVFDGTDWNKSCDLQNDIVTDQNIGYNINARTNFLSVINNNDQDGYLTYNKSGDCWNFIEPVILPSAISNSLQCFGCDMDGHADVLVMGDDNGNSFRGQIVVSDKLDTNMWESVLIKSPSNGSQVGFGTDVQVFEQSVYVGAPRLSGTNSGQGGIYKYEHVNGVWENTFLYQFTSPFLIGQGKRIHIDEDYIFSVAPGGFSDAEGDILILNHAGGFVGRIKELNPDEMDFGGFMSFDGNRLVVTTQVEESDFDTNLFKAYVFRKDMNWELEVVIDFPPFSRFVSFNSSIKYQDGLLSVGDEFNDDVGNNAGAVYIFDIDNIVAVDYTSPLQESFSIFPNPTKGNTNVIIESDEIFEHYSIYSMDGKIIANRLPLFENMVDLNSIPAGRYLLEIDNENNSLAKILIVQ